MYLGNPARDEMRDFEGPTSWPIYRQIRPISQVMYCKLVTFEFGPCIEVQHNPQDSQAYRVVQTRRKNKAREH